MAAADFAPLVPRAPEGPPKSGGRGGAASSGGSRLPKMRPRRSRREASVIEVPCPRKITPIWLGSGTREDPVIVRNISEIVPEELRQHEAVQAIERLECGVAPCEAQKKFITAAECLEQAINLRRKLLGDAHQDLLAAVERYVVSCNIWGVQCLGAGQYTCSLELLTKAEATTEADNVPNFKRRIALRAATFNNLCCYFRHRGKLNAALQYAERALKIEQRYKDAEDPARTHLNYAVLLSMVSRNEDALEHIESAIAMLHNEETTIEAGAGSGSGDTGSVRIMERQEEIAYILVVAYYNMWVELSRLSRREAGVDCIIRAANISKRKLGSTHPLTAKMEETLMGMQAPAQQHDNLAEIYAAERTTALPPELAPRQLPPLEAEAAWQAAEALKKHGGDALAVLADAQVIKLRVAAKETPFPRPLSSEERRSPFKKGLHQLKVKIMGRSEAEPLPPKPQTPAFVADLRDPIFETRPKLESLASPSYAGSPALQQQAHGVQPMTAARPRTAGSDLTPPGVSPRPLAPLETYPQAEAPAGRELRAAYEYHWKQVQQRVNGDGSDAEVPTAAARLRAIGVFRSRLEERRGRGLPPASEQGRHRAATKLQASFRGYLVRQWTPRELAKQSQRNAVPGRSSSPGGFSTAAPPTLAEVSEESANGDENEEEGSGAMTPQGPPDMKRRIAFRVIYAARRAFLEHGAAVKIQKTWRGYAARRDIQRQVENVAQGTATKLQALWRRWSVVRWKWERHDAAVVIQTTARGWLARRLKERRLRFTRLLTRVAVGHIVRKRLRRRQQAVLPLQRAFRGFSACRRLRRRRLGAEALQTEFRGWRCRRRFAIQRAAACLIASSFRGFARRRHVQKRHEAASRVQRQLRIHNLQRQDKKRNAAASRIGAFYRGRLARRLRPYGSSARKIQARIRGVLQRKRLRRWPSAALQIQASWRGRTARHRLKTKVALAVALQRLARKRLTEMELRRVEAATVLCQLVARGQRCKKELRRRHAEATRIQAFWRGARRRCGLVGAAVAAQQIQKAWRRWSALRRLRALRAAATAAAALRRGLCARRRFCRVRRAAVRLQAVSRGHLCRRRLLRERRAATSVQRCWRRRRLRMELRRRHAAAARIQSAFRGHLQKDRYMALRFAIKGLQKAGRRRLAQRRFAKLKRLATSLQAVWRGRTSRRFLRRQHFCAEALQCFWRCHRVRARLLAEDRSANKLQALVLGHLARQRVRRRQKAAAAIQCCVRLVLQRVHLRRRAAAKKIALWARAKVGRWRYRRQRKAAVVLQKNFRAFLARRRWRRLRPCLAMLKCRHRWKKVRRSVQSINCAWRRQCAYARLRRMRLSVLTLQRLGRGWLARRRLHRQQEAATLLQAHVRRCHAARRLAAIRLLQSALGAAVRQRRAADFVRQQRREPVARIGAAWRGRLAQRQLGRQREGAIVIQRHVRGHLTRKRVAFLRDKAPVPIQRFVRKRAAKERAERLRWRAHQEELRGESCQRQLSESRQGDAAVRIQAFYRMRSQCRWYRQMRSSALPRLQGFCRMIIVRKACERRRRHAVTLERYARGLCGRKLGRQRRAAAAIQRAYRQRLLRSPDFSDVLRSAMAARRVQAAWRRHLAYWRYLRTLVAAVRLQAQARAWLGRRRYLEKRAAARKIQVSFAKVCSAKRERQRRSDAKLKLQAFGRQMLVRLRLQRWQREALRIQAAWRGAKGRQRVEERQRAATRLQCYFRMRSERSKRQPQRMRHRSALQACALSWRARTSLQQQRQAATQIQKAYRQLCCRRRLLAALRLARALQKLWRGRGGRGGRRTASRRLQRLPAHVRGHRWRQRLQPERSEAAVAVQRWWRGEAARRSLRRKAAAAAALQAWWRMRLARKRHLPKRTAATQIQAFWRMRVQREQFLAQQQRLGRCGTVNAMRDPAWQRRRALTAVVRVQRAARGFLQRRRRLPQTKLAAATIQRCVRGYLQRRRTERRRRALAKLQAALAGACWRRRYAERRAEVVRLQASAKAWVARQRVAELRGAQLEIARQWRGAAARRTLRRRQAASARLGAAWRCFSAKRAYHGKLRAARLIQATWLLRLDREAAAEEEAAAVRLQAWWRGLTAQSSCAASLRAGEIIVGGAVMGRLARLQRRRSAAATVIAAWWRGHCTRLRLGREAEAARRLQRWWQGTLALREWRSVGQEALLDLLEAKLRREAYLGFHASVIQRCFRRSREERPSFWRMRRAVVRLQALARRRLATRKVQRMRAEAGVRLGRLPARKAVLMRDYRGCLTKSRFMRWEDDEVGLPARSMVDVDRISARQRAEVGAAVAPLQSFVKWQMFLRSVLTIQSRWRGHAGRKALQRKQLEVTRLQAMWRRYRAGEKVRSMQRAVKMLQAGARGLLERRGLEQASRS